MTESILWQGRIVPFEVGDTVAGALTRAGIADFGAGSRGQRRGVFCGIGQCQCCLVTVDGCVTEACLMPCAPGLSVTPEMGAEG
ncbi:2Fe-2S iron-sulfur cluster-binding protein [Solirhodobacter olei]|uniref:2Fe-2S iron-sulfur cluster-binding protein n=1 Tax=Solirhodobacter olei TaxID=2493082 RepID=UPI000FD72CD7|nr:2Fe-2S iron-sulfur cluster-binding protein [Solirhodobacter olei]